MTFAYPLVLLALVFPAWLLVWTWRRSGRRVVLPFDHGLAGRGRRWAFLLGVFESINPLLLGVVILLLAGPQRFAQPEEKRQVTNIELCVDVSGSMTASFGDGTNYDGAMQAVEQFIDYRKGDAVGLTFFGNNYLHWCPLTKDISAVRCAPPFMRPENLPGWFGGTEIGKALRGCKKVLVERSEGDRLIILISDGYSADLHDDNAAQVAKEMKDAGITVFTIIIGEAIQDEIVTICAQTGGESYTASDPEALSLIFKRIDELKQAPLEKKIAEAQDNFGPICLVGLGLLSQLLLGAYGIRYTPW